MTLFCAAIKEVFLLYAYWFGARIFTVFEMWQKVMWRFLVTTVASSGGCYVYFVGYFWLTYPSYEDRFVVVSTWVFGILSRYKVMTYLLDGVSCIGLLSLTLG